MLLKKWKTFPMPVLAVLFFIIAFAVGLGACDDDILGGQTGDDDITDGDGEKNYLSGRDALDWGISSAADVLTLGLVPGNDTTEINFTWYSSGSVSGKVTKVRLVRGTFTDGAELFAEDAETSGTATASAGYTTHKATIKNLKPGFSYQYAVSSDGTHWSEVYDFKIPEENGTFRFAVVSDVQVDTWFVENKSRYPDTDVTNGQGWIETMEKIVAANVSFIANGGDQVGSSGGEPGYLRFFAPPGLRSIPFSPVAGNHDSGLAYNYHFNWPNPQTFENETISAQVGRNYFYRYNTILFVVLNTAPYPTSRSAALPYIERFDSAITAAKAAHAGKYDWLIVQHHKSTASVAEHCADTDIQYYVEAGFEKIMSDHGVDFVLAGHDHVYARSYPLSGRDGGKVSVPDTTRGGNEIDSPNDPIYLTFTTASGVKYYPARADDTFPWVDGYLSNRANPAYPYLGQVTDEDGTSSTLFGSISYLAGHLPVSNAAFVQPYIPSYTIVDVNGKTITFKTYAIATKSGTDVGASESYSFDADTPYDWITVTK